MIVSRLSDGLPSHWFAGLLSIGDEILEINGHPVPDLKLDDVYELMADGDKQKMTSEKVCFVIVSTPRVTQPKEIIVCGEIFFRKA